MTDITSITTILSSIKTATELAKVIKDSDISLSNAESKLNMADLISTLADVKFELAEVQDTLREKDQEIFSLTNQLKEKKEMKFDGKVYFIEGDETPFCPVCYENNAKLHHLTFYNGTRDCESYYHCKTCKNNF